MLVCAALALEASRPSAAFAQSAPSSRAESPKARAAELVNGATTAYRNGELQRATALLLQAYELDPQPVLLFNLARAYEGLGDVDAALAALEHYLQADPRAPDRGAIEQRIGTLKRQREERIALEKQRDEERRRAEEERAKRAKATASNVRERSVVPYVLVGAGVAGLATGTVFRVLSGDRHDSAARLSTSQVSAVREQDTAESYATVATIAFVSGGVLAAAGITWWVVERRAPASTTRASTAVGVGLAPGMLTLGGVLP